MSAQSIDVTAAITPDDPKTMSKAQKYALIATSVAVGAYVVLKTVQKFSERKRVVVTVADQPEA